MEHSEKLNDGYFEILTLIIVFYTLISSICSKWTSYSVAVSYSSFSILFMTNNEVHLIYSIQIFWEIHIYYDYYVE